MSTAVADDVESYTAIQPDSSASNWSRGSSLTAIRSRMVQQNLLQHARKTLYHMVHGHHRSTLCCFPKRKDFEQYFYQIFTDRRFSCGWHTNKFAAKTLKIEGRKAFFSVLFPLTVILSWSFSASRMQGKKNMYSQR